MTVRELIDKLEWSIEKGYIKDEDYVFYTLPNKDEGNISNLRPVSNIANPSIRLFPEDEVIEEMLQKQSIDLCFIKISRDRKLNLKEKL